MESVGSSSKSIDPDSISKRKGEEEYIEESNSRIHLSLQLFPYPKALKHFGHPNGKEEKETCRCTFTPFDFIRVQLHPTGQLVIGVGQI